MKALIEVIGVSVFVLITGAPGYASETVTQPAVELQTEPAHEADKRLCSGVSPEGEVVYFPCGNPPTLVCSEVTLEGEIIYFVCNSEQQKHAQ